MGSAKQTKKDLENKISELEEKLTRLNATMAETPIKKPEAKKPVPAADNNYELGLHSDSAIFKTCITQMGTAMSDLRARKDAIKAPAKGNAPLTIAAEIELLDLENQKQDIEKRLRLMELGAEQAFAEGRPANLQFLLFGTEDILLSFRYCSYWGAIEIVGKYQGSIDAISLLTQGKSPEQKQEILDEMLYRAVNEKRRDGLFTEELAYEALIPSLLAAGANPNGHDNEILVWAVRFNATQETIDALCTAGADFGLAVDRAIEISFGGSTIPDLKRLRKKYAGISDDPMDEIQKLKKELLTANEKIARLEAISKASQPNSPGPT